MVFQVRNPFFWGGQQSSCELLVSGRVTLVFWCFEISNVTSRPWNFFHAEGTPHILFEMGPFLWGPVDFHIFYGCNCIKHTWIGSSSGVTFFSGNPPFALKWSLPTVRFPDPTNCIKLPSLEMFVFFICKLMGIKLLNLSSMGINYQQRIAGVREHQLKCFLMKKAKHI